MSRRWETSSQQPFSTSQSVEIRFELTTTKNPVSRLHIHSFLLQRTASSSLPHVAVADFPTPPFPGRSCSALELRVRSGRLPPAIRGWREGPTCRSSRGPGAGGVGGRAERTVGARGPLGASCPSWRAAQACFPAHCCNPKQVSNHVVFLGLR